MMNCKQGSFKIILNCQEYRGIHYAGTFSSMHNGHMIHGNRPPHFPSAGKSRLITIRDTILLQNLFQEYDPQAAVS